MHLLDGEVYGKLKNPPRHPLITTGGSILAEASNGQRL